jgi:5-methylcytosine-specific restriction protein B
MSELHPLVERDLWEILRQEESEGNVLSPAKLQQYYDAFRGAFGPQILRSLDGMSLLEHMHDHGNRDSLVYWLEFKNDDTFPGGRFGSISGGSALKFGVFRRAETGVWATTGNGRYPRDIPAPEAIDIARRHRDQLVAATDVLVALPESIDDSTYLKLQRDLEQVAPDVENTAWGHKYLSLLFPTRLDDYHVAEYQRHHLIKLLQLPPKDKEDWAEGRYVCAGRFVALSRLLNTSLNETTTILNRRDGSPIEYWRIDLSELGQRAREEWNEMRAHGLVHVGWPKVGDLSELADSLGTKEAIADRVSKFYPGSPKSIGNAVNQLLRFSARYNPRDRITVTLGENVLGIGELSGPYTYNPTSASPHERRVTWKSLVEWKELPTESRRSSLGTIKDPPNRVAIERHIIEDASSVAGAAVAVDRTMSGASFREDSPASASRSTLALPRLQGELARVQEILERKGQVILYGPPGTGKTYWALRASQDLASLRAFGKPYGDLQESEKSRVFGGSSAMRSLVRVVSFHPEYGYEDFIEGYRPDVSPDGSLVFSLRAGVFFQLCVDAVGDPIVDYFLVIDEINRGDIPRIFGELLTLLERDKRGVVMPLPASGKSFLIPRNVFVVGTMNTADRSIALLDIALRRRFGFEELMPDYSLLRDAVINGLPLAAWLEDLNRRIRNHGVDGRSRQIGHAFFLGESGRPIATPSELAAVLRDDIIPLLQEYTYEDFDLLEDMLGKELIDGSEQRIRYELFDPSRSAELTTALFRPEIATATSAVLAAAGSESLSSNEEMADEADDADPRT